MTSSSFSIQKMLCCGILLMFSLLQRLKICWGDELGTEFCWPKEKKSKYRIAFYSISEVPFPKDMKNLCNPRKRSIIGV